MDTAIKTLVALVKKGEQIAAHLQAVISSSEHIGIGHPIYTLHIAIHTAVVPLRILASRIGAHAAAFLDPTSGLVYIPNVMWDDLEEALTECYGYFDAFDVIVSNLAQDETIGEYDEQVFRVSCNEASDISVITGHVLDISSSSAATHLFNPLCSHVSSSTPTGEHNIFCKLHELRTALTFTEVPNRQPATYESLQPPRLQLVKFKRMVDEWHAYMTEMVFERWGEKWPMLCAWWRVAFSVAISPATEEINHCGGTDTPYPDEEIVFEKEAHEMFAKGEYVGAIECLEALLNLHREHLHPDPDGHEQEMEEPEEPEEPEGVDDGGDSDDDGYDDDDENEMLERFRLPAEQADTLKVQLALCLFLERRLDEAEDTFSSISEQPVERRSSCQIETISRLWDILDMEGSTSRDQIQFLTHYPPSLAKSLAFEVFDLPPPSSSSSSSSSSSWPLSMSAANHPLELPDLINRSIILEFMTLPV